jgi:hypothetical protein
MRLPSCGGSRSWLRNPPRARTSKHDFPAAPRAIRIPPSGSPPFWARLAQYLFARSAREDLFARSAREDLFARYAREDLFARSAARIEAEAALALADWTDQALLGDAGDEYAVLEESAGRQPEAI